VALHADVEVGGTEQLFNLIAGRTLQRAFDQQPQAVITCPLLLGLDGRKMSKSYDNAIGLEETSGEMYGKVMAFPDDQILTGFELCTEVPLDDLDAMAEQLAGGANPMGLKKRLAWEIAHLYHGAEAASAAQDAFEREVQRKERPLDIPPVLLPRGDGWPVADLMVTVGLTQSKSEARRKVQEGAVYVDELRVMADHMIVNVRDGMVIKLGRKYRVLRLPQ
jgi:tyrosyl-tRNA synthetase